MEVLDPDNHSMKTECSKSLMHLRYVNNDWGTPGREEKHEPHNNWGDIYSHKECGGDSYNVEWETQNWPSEMHGDNASTLLMLGGGCVSLRAWQSSGLGRRPVSWCLYVFLVDCRCSRSCSAIRRPQRWASSARHRTPCPLCSCTPGPRTRLQRTR